MLTISCNFLETFKGQNYLSSQFCKQETETQEHNTICKTSDSRCIMVRIVSRSSKLQHHSHYTSPTFTKLPELLAQHKHTHTSRSVLSDSLRSHGLQPTRLFSPWDFPGMNTGVGCRFLLQSISLFFCLPYLPN